MASSARAVRLTRLCSIHPYPAMIADSLAMRLARKYAQPGKKFLDPFCGTSRTVMASAAFGMESVGLDVNPLAVLISRAKAANVRADELSSLLAGSERWRNVEPIRFDLEPDRKVQWLSRRAQFELNQIITWINSSSATQDARLVLAAILSATTREVSYCRKGQWKLHRMSAKERRQFRPSGWEVFARRVARSILEIKTECAVGASAKIVLGDCTTLSGIVELSALGPFDLVITSPPYGDSRTTLGYGGVSALCLGVVQHVVNLATPYLSPGAIDNSCLGGKNPNRVANEFNLRQYWAGGKKSEARPRSQNFLADLGLCCSQLNLVLARKSRVVFVVSRRSAGGRRLYIDEFLKDNLTQFGFSPKGVETRIIAGKMTPNIVNSRGASDDTVRVNTMRQELIISFERG
jgi:site-specific DNA-methyltransferase (cytosine-N4-specific)